MRIASVLYLSLLLGCSAEAAPLTLKTQDGQSIAAELDGRGKAGVILLHDKGRSSNDFKLFADRLVRAGFRVLRIDLRGHGDSASATGDGPSMVHDVAAAVEALRGRGATSISMVGAGLGANLAVHAAGSIEGIERIVLLSPAISVEGVKIVSAYGQVASTPVLLAATSGDTSGARTVQFLEGKATGPKRLMMLDGADTGAAMLSASPALEDNIMGWLQGNYDAGGLKDDNAPIQVDAIEQQTSKGDAFGSSK